MWIPPIYEEATNTPGNVATVRNFFNEEAHGTASARR